jgi:AraC family transcriptional regulator
MTEQPTALGLSPLSVETRCGFFSSRSGYRAAGIWDAIAEKGFDEMGAAILHDDTETRAAAGVSELPTRPERVEIHRFVSRPQFTMRHTSTSSCEFATHSHSLYTVTVVLSGQMSAVIGGSEFELAAGDVAFTNVGQDHSGCSTGVEFVSMGVSPVLVNEIVAEIGLVRAAEVVFRSSVVRDEAILKIAQCIAAEIAGERLGRAAMLEAQARQLVIRLLRDHLTVRKSDQIELSRAGLVDRRLRRAIEFMHDNFGRELALEDIAAAAYLSEYHFARLFKQITGVTPHVYLANVRLERARKLLAETSLAISEIASAVGYQSQSHFTKMFKAVTGVTPRSYREAAK